MNLRIAVFHFSPIELFPPMMNFLEYAQEHLPSNVQLRVFTTKSSKDILPFQINGNQIQIYRYGQFTLGLPSILRYIQYGRYNFLSFLNSMRWRPQKMFYCETISSFVPWLIHRYFNKHTKVFIHYHEYMTPNEYQLMYLNRTFHRLERQLYSQAKWISHTNEARMKMFLGDIGYPSLSNAHVLPNYPPLKWNTEPYSEIKHAPIRLVYLGSFRSLEILYIKEVFEWVKTMNGKIQLDIFSLSISEPIKNYMNDLKCNKINWKGAIAYSEIPKVLPQYDVGLIMYKGVSPNTIYSASNKLFEYLALGLDVWYPKDIIGSYPYDSNEDWPKVLRLDFSNLSQYDIGKLTNRDPGHRRKIAYNHEDAIHDLFSALISTE